MSDFSLLDLEAIVRQRASASPDQSWTAKLVAAGPEKATKKLGEEAVETIIAALGDDRDALIGESADLLYHLLVTLHLRDVSLAEILEELQRRTGQSGLAEKAGRSGA